MKFLSVCLTIIIFAVNLAANDEKPQEDNSSETVPQVKLNFINHLQQNGVSFELNYTSEFMGVNFNQADPNIHYMDNFILGTSFDLEKLLHWNNSQLALSVLGNNGNTPNDICGTLQGISNIETNKAWKVYEVRLETFLLGKQLSLLAGLYDLNSEFDVRESSSLFTNPSHGIGAEYALSGLNGPSIFPNTSLAFRINYAADNDMYLRAAVLDGVPGHPENAKPFFVSLNSAEGVLSVFESGYQSKTELFDEGFIKMSIGSWFYSSEFDALNDAKITSKEISYGLYASAEGTLYKSKESDYAGFIRLGYANGAVNQVQNYFGTGIVVNSPLGITESVLGFAIAIARNSKDYMNLASTIENNKKEYEINFELTYDYLLTDWLSIQPDLQYFINPCDKPGETLFVTGVRFNFAFN